MNLRVSIDLRKRGKGEGTYDDGLDLDLDDSGDLDARLAGLAGVVNLLGVALALVLCDRHRCEQIIRSEGRRATTYGTLLQAVRDRTGEVVAALDRSRDAEVAVSPSHQ